MKIHYNNGRSEKLIGRIMAIQVIGSNCPVIAITENGQEYQISLDNIEMIIDDSLSDNAGYMREAQT